MMPYYLQIGDKVISTRLYAVSEIVRHYPRKVVPDFDIPLVRIVFDNTYPETLTVDEITKLFEENPMVTVYSNKTSEPVSNFESYNTLRRIRHKHVPNLTWNEDPVEIILIRSSDVSVDS